ncbi:MAG: hypothetical protein ACP5J4_01575 [Anaerolineae bacterium]
MRKQPGFLGILIVLVVVAGLLVWWIGSLTNGDQLWFLRVFNAQADWIAIYWDGGTYMLFPEDAVYEEVMSAFADAVAHWVGYEEEVGLSNDRLEHYREEGRLLELHYNTSVQVHTRHSYPRARSFFVPLAGTDADFCRIFAGLGDTPRSGVLNASDARFARLLATVEQAVPGY